MFNKNKNKRILQISILAVFLIVAILAYILNYPHYLSFDLLKQHSHSLLTYVEIHPILSSLIYIGVYIVIVTFGLPGAFFMSVTGGFLFGLYLGLLNVVIGATIGATFLFLLARFVIADIARAKTGPWLQKMENIFQENALSYLLILRLIPVFPFLLVNLAAAVIGAPLRTYIIATFLGIIPGAYLYVSAGTELGSIFERGGTFAGTWVITPSTFVMLSCLALLAITPVIYKIITNKERL